MHILKILRILISSGSEKKKKRNHYRLLFEFYDGLIHRVTSDQSILLYQDITITGWFVKLVKN